MKFKQATDALLEATTLQDLAQAMGVSIQAVRQARAIESSNAYRTAPKGWEKAIELLAKRQASKLRKLALRLENNGNMT